MPRKPRFYLPGVPVHIVQRGHSREPVFFELSDYAAYLEWLGEGAEKYHCAIHAYVLMTNHVHILATPEDTDSVGRMMQAVGRKYVPYINYSHGTSGSIWEGRYKASIVQEDTYLLSCMRYIELNPVRANMVNAPGEYRWSSYAANGLGEVNKLVTPHLLYNSLGQDEDGRRNAYRGLFEVYVDKEELNNIRQSLQTGTPLGNDYFKQKVEEKLQCKIGLSMRGRPIQKQG